MNAQKGACVILLGFCVASCAANGGPDYVADGELIVDWTLDGTKDPYACRDWDAPTIDITVFTLRDRLAGEYQQDCETFATTIDLRPGDYRASAVLLDPAGYDRTTVVDVPVFTLYSEDVLQVPIAFPSSSFY